MTKIRGVPPGSWETRMFPAAWTAAHFHSDFRRSFRGSLLAAGGGALDCCTVTVTASLRKLHVDPFFDLLGSLLKLLNRLFGEVLAGQKPFQLAGRCRRSHGIGAHAAILEHPLGVDEQRRPRPDDLQLLAGLACRCRAAAARSRVNCFAASSIVLDGMSGWSRVTANTATLSLSLYLACNCSITGTIGSPTVASLRQK